MLRLGLVGFGDGGQHFHAPYIEAAEGVELAGIVTRSPARIESARQQFPDVPVYDSLTDMLAAGVDAVTITTPPETRRALVMEAIDAGVHVIADKPFAQNAKGAQALADAAKEKGVTLGVYHNRRFDADILTLRKLLNRESLGEVWRIHSRMDLDNPHTIEPGPTGGVLRDLGSHLVDQMLWLFGPVQSVMAFTDRVDLPEGETDVGFTLALTHRSGVVSHVSASKLNKMEARELRVYAEHGHYVANSTDVQTQAVFAGKRPVDDLSGWGYEREERWGKMTTAAGTEAVPSEQGNYHHYYEAFAHAVSIGALPPVTADDGVAVLRVLDAAAVSAREHRVVRL